MTRPMPRIGILPETIEMMGNETAHNGLCLPVEILIQGLVARQVILYLSASVAPMRALVPRQADGSVTGQSPFSNLEKFIRPTRKNF